MRLGNRLGRIMVAIAAVALPMASTPGLPMVAASGSAGAKCLGKQATIVGSTGDDVLKGTFRRDVINARGGSDEVKSVGKGDTVCGGRGPDHLKGGEGDDVLSGGKGEDTLDGGADTDTCNDSANTTYESCEKPKFELQVGKADSGGGTVTSDPAGINCGVDCTQRYAPGTEVELVAAPDEESVFAGWSTSTGECDIASPETCVVTMNSAGTATAFFAATYTLAVTKGGTGSGTVTSNVDGINCGVDCSENYLDGTIVELTASESGGSAFDGWSGGGCSGTGTCEVTMDQARSVTATFTTVVFALVVSKGGPGSGTVTSDPEGIDCGGDCIQGYPVDTIVTLNATDDPGSDFEGWSGDCSGTGSCVITMTEGKSVTATFGPEDS